jgi:hypothetical protein
MPLTTITNVETYTCVVVKILANLMFYIFSIVSKDSNDRRWYLCEINLVHEVEWMKKNSRDIIINQFFWGWKFTTWG